MARDMTGSRFGRLVAVRDIGAENKCRIWEFRCDCGQVVAAKAIAVRSGKKHSCGCLARELSSARKRSQLVGEVFGRLTVIECLGPDKNGHVRWQCLCSCGAQCAATGNILKNGKKKSCGCLRKEVTSLLGSKSKKDNPYSQTKEYRSELRKRLRQNPVHAMGERISRLLAYGLKGIGAAKGGRTFEMLGYTPEQFASHIERQFRNGMSWDNRDKWHIDHIIPVSTAETLADLIALNQLSNLRPLWAEENNLKRAKIVSLI